MAGSAACGSAVPAARAERSSPPPASAPIRGPAVVVTGKVETADGSLRVAGRDVDAVNLATGERRTVLTDRQGDFAMTLLPGTWRLDLRLEPGETLAKRPAPITVASAAPPRALQFRVTPVSYHPLRPAKPRTTGLGAPVA